MKFKPPTFCRAQWTFPRHDLPTTPAGRLTTLYNLCSQTFCLDGIEPEAPLLQDTNGTFYGMAAQGSTQTNNGYIYRRRRHGDHGCPNRRNHRHGESNPSGGTLDSNVAFRVVH